MNQILSTTNQTNKKPTVINIKKIIMFFCATIIIFGLGLAGFKIYQIYNENQKISQNIKPEIVIEQKEEKVKISVIHQNGIEKVEYYWDEKDIKVIKGNGSKKIEKEIELLSGENTLTVKVTDTKGTETKSSNKFTYNIDKKKPIIKLETLEEEGKIKITVTDETKLNYMTYKWGNNAEEKIFATEEETKIEKIILIERGTNKLLVTAVDASKNKSTEEVPYQGIINPTIDAYQQGDTLYIKAIHDMGFEKLEFTINGEAYTYDKNFPGYNKELTTLEFTAKLKPGENIIIITANSLEQTQSIARYKTIYNP